MSYNIFNHAHLPLKTALISGCITLTGSEHEVPSSEKCIRKIEEVLRVFYEQVKFETAQILPFIFEYEPSIWNTYTTEHHKGNNLACNLESLMLACDKAKDEKEKLALFKVLKEAYNTFVLFNFHHMDDEEPVLNEILWRYYPDSFMKEITEGINFHSSLKYEPQREELEMAEAA